MDVAERCPDSICGELPAPLQEIIDGDYLSQAGKTYQLEFQRNFLGKIRNSLPFSP